MKAESDAGHPALRDSTPRLKNPNDRNRLDLSLQKMTERPQSPEDKAFQQSVLDWFHVHGRKDLPWQIERTPYRVWVSEIMLQQTQVTSVIPFFERFVGRLPDVAALAQANRDVILELWAGLGYYARARNLHHAAQIIMERFEGGIPADLAALTALPGIGRSTAGAIVSLGHGRSAPILDGNVKRVLCRYRGIEGWPGLSAVERRLWSMSEQLTPCHDASHYNQAMMDLGATVCMPRNPACPTCPLSDRCRARISDRTSELPAPKPRRHIPTRRTCALLLHNEQGHLYLERRPPSGIWGGLWCLPLIEHREELDGWAAGHGIVLSSIKDLPTRRHTFSHFHLEYVPLLVQSHQVNRIGEPGQELWHPAGNRCKIGLPAPIRTLLDDLGYFDPTE